jgi:hypothetical protein
MPSISDTLEEIGVTKTQTIRPTRVVLLLGSQGGSLQETVSQNIRRKFSAIGIKVFAVSPNFDPLSSEFLDCDILGLIGSPKSFTKLRSLRARPEGPILLAFASKSLFEHARSFLKISDAVVLCETTNVDWINDVSDLVFHFFESLVVPSLLNIDIADVRNIAKGIGLAFNEADDNAKDIISRLPASCLVARSALLHFSCTDEVKLREIYSISKSIAMKQGIDLPEEELRTHADARKLIRRVNVKMGIRIRETPRSESWSRSPYIQKSRRISLTAILFGI